MRWSSRLGDPQIGLPLVHHSGGLNSARRKSAGQSVCEFYVPLALCAMPGEGLFECCCDCPRTECSADHVLFSGRAANYLADDISQTKIPQPVATLKAGLVWEWPDVAEWARETGREVVGEG